MHAAAATAQISGSH